MATTTENYGLIKPGKNDNVNVDDLNKNFDAIDGELKKRPVTINGAEPDEDGNVEIGATGYYDLDLTEIVAFATDSTEALDFDVSGAYSWALVQAAVEAGQLVRVHFTENNGLREASVLLTDVYSVEGSGDYYLQCVYAPRGGTNYFKVRLEFVYDEDYDAYDALMIFTPGTATADSQIPTNISAVKADSTITVTTTLEDGSTSTSVITLDENEYPVSIVTDGVECALELAGFDEEASP